MIPTDVALRDVASTLQRIYANSFAAESHGTYKDHALILSCDPSNKYVSHDDVGNLYFRYDVAAATISCVALFLVAMLIYSDKKLQTHPNKLIASICLCDSYTFCQFVIRYYFCGFRLYSWISQMFAYSAQYPIQWLQCKVSGDETCWQEKQ